MATNRSLTGGSPPSGTLAHFLPPYWDAVLGENLYPNLYFYQFGTKRMVPRNFGTTIKIPRFKSRAKSNSVIGTIVAASEGVAIGTCPVCTQYISGTMAQYAGAYRHTDLLIMTSMSDVVELSLIDIARDIARRMDRTIRNALSGSGAILSDTATGKAAILKPATIMQAVVTLDAADNPRPADNHYPTIIHPVVAYDLQNNLSGGGWLDVTKYTDANVGRIYLGEIGRMYGARFITSSNIRRVALSSSLAVSGVRNYMFAPDSYYVTEISDMTARTYVKNLGSGGTSDPVNQIATVGAKVYFGVVPASWDATETRMVRLTYKTGLAGGDTVA